jgi:hypothetical protein
MTTAQGSCQRTRSSRHRSRCEPRPREQRPRPNERGQRRRGSTDCTATTARQQAGRRGALRAGPPRSTHTPSTRDRNGRSVRTAATQRRGTRAAAEPPVGGEVARAVGRTARSRCTLIAAGIVRGFPRGIPSKEGREGAVEVRGQVPRGGGRIRPDHYQRAGRQRADPITGKVSQLPLHPVSDDRVPDCFGYDEAHSSRCFRSPPVQVHDDRPATGATSPTHCGGELTAVAHSVGGGEHPTTATA